MLWILPMPMAKSAKVEERGLFCVLNRTECLQESEDRCLGGVLLPEGNT